ncbi:hypothetical protein LCL97_07690 [Seohaeicola saemankumensis]|nr:hypothetical protein [Seohaeicola saemankumensis]MCA0870700.1 hypothetical protein [Seohaeicola saemankumensis]
MPLTEDQRAFVTTYILTREFDEARRKERQDELDALAKGKVGGDHSELEAMLARTGRTEDPNDPGKRAEKKEQHLREVLLLDEDGLNINQVVDAIAPPPDRATRDLAKTEITDATSTRDKAAIELARERVEAHKVAARAAQEAAAAELEVLVAAEELARGPGRDARNAAMHELAHRHGQRSLSHYATRHGAHTTDDEQVRRVATGYAPDNAPPVGAGPLAATTDSGETVSLPDVTQRGPNAVGSASRWASAEAQILAVEQLLAEAQQARARGEIDEDTKLKQTTLIDPGDEAIGHSAKLTPSAPGSTTYVFPGTTTQVPSPARLDKTPAQLASLADTPTKSDVIRKRAEAVTIERNVRGATTILQAMPDGSFRTVTAYPDESVTTAELLDETRNAALSNDPNDVQARQLVLAGAALTAATQQVADATNAATAAAAERDTRKQAAMDAIRASIEALPTVPEGWDSTAHDALLALQRAVQKHTPAKQQIEALEDSEADLLAAKATIDAEVNAATANVANLTAIRNTAQAQSQPGAMTGLSNADKALRRNAYYAAERNLTEAQTALDWVEDVQAALEAQYRSFVQAMPKAIAEEDKLKQAADFAFQAAVAATDEPTARDIRDKAEANTRAMSAYAEAQQAAKDADVAVNEARRVRALAQESVDQKTEQAPITDDAVTAERDARKDELQQALAAGGDAFAEKKQQWLDEIDAVAKMMEDDAIDRAARVQKIDAERDVARDAQDAARKALDTAVAALDEFGDDTSSEGFKQAVLRVDELTRARDAAEATFKRIRGQYQDFKEQARMQDREDETNIELARARAEAVATEAEVAQLTAAGTPIPEELAKRKALADATEAHRKAELDYYQSVDAARQAKAALRVVTEALEDATVEMDRISAGPGGSTSPEAGAAMDKIDKLTRLRDDHETAETEAIARREALQTAMNDAARAARALKG